MFDKISLFDNSIDDNQIFEDTISDNIVKQKTGLRN
jgi:hypothetical protein